MRHHHRETQHRHAMTSMSSEAKRLSSLIAGLRKSVLDIDKERAKIKDASDPALEILDIRRTNLLTTIAALEDRLSAVQGLIDLDRPHVVHRSRMH